MNVNLAAITNIVGAIVGDVEVESAVAVDVGQGQGHAAETVGCSGRASDVGKMAFAIILKTLYALAGGGDEQIEKAIAVQIGKNGATIIFVREGQTGFARDIFEFPLAEILVESVGRIEAAKENVGQAIVVEIATATPEPLKRTRLAAPSHSSSVFVKARPVSEGERRVKPALPEAGTFSSAQRYPCSACHCNGVSAPKPNWRNRQQSRKLTANRHLIPADNLRVYGPNPNKD